MLSLARVRLFSVVVGKRAGLELSLGVGSCRSFLLLLGLKLSLLDLLLELDSQMSFLGGALTTFFLLPLLHPSVPFSSFNP